MACCVPLSPIKELWLKNNTYPPCDQVSFYWYWYHYYEPLQALCPVRFSAHDIRHLFVSEFLITLRLACGSGTDHFDSERYLREREAFGSLVMGWQSPRTIDIYDQSRDGERALVVLSTYQQKLSQRCYLPELPCDTAPGQVQREGEMLFEPESLYRGALYACALASLALTNGSRVSELLQVSASRFETLVVDELKNQQPTGRKMGILVQNLLPKGSRHESERQFFLIGEMAGRLLREIGQLLETTHHGVIPTVSPYRNNKAEDLSAEPYLFQWAASDDGIYGTLSPDDVGRLLRFLFYGLTLTTRTGKPIRVATHLLRHVLATHARTIQNVPAEAVAYLLHHRVLLPDGTATRAVSISEATSYYSGMTTEQLLAMLFEAQSQMSPTRNVSYLQVPSPRSLEQMDAAICHLLIRCYQPKMRSKIRYDICL